MFRRRSDNGSEMTAHVYGAESKILPVRFLMGLKLTDSFKELRSKGILRKPLL